MELELEKLFDLPAHPLLVHIPVVLLPLAAIGTVLTVASARWRERIGWITVALAGVSLVFVQLAIGSGEALEEAVENRGSRELIEDHAAIADTMLPIALLLFVAITAYMVYTWRKDRAGAAGSGDGASARRDPLALTIAGLGLVLALLSVVWVVRTGHSGAKATWNDVQLEEEGEDHEGLAPLTP